MFSEQNVIQKKRKKNLAKLMKAFYLLIPL